MSGAPTLERPTMPEVEITTAVTPSLHPQNVLSLDGYDNETAPAVAPVLDAMRAAYEGLSQVHAAREAAAKDPSMTDAARVLRIAAFGEQHQNAITRKFDAAHANLTKAINALDSSLNEPLKLRADRPGIAGEVRSFVKGLSLAERENWFNERQRAGDMESLEHILGAPGYLSGLSDDERAVRTRFYHRLRQPVAARRLDVMRAGLNLIEQRGPLVWGELEKAVGADSRKVARLKEAKSAAEQAFILRGDKSAA